MPPDLLQYGNGSALKDSQQTFPPFYLMTADLATALLNRAANGAELLEVLESITADVEQENIADAAAHYAAISAPTANPIQF